MKNYFSLCLLFATSLNSFSQYQDVTTIMSEYKSRVISNGGSINNMDLSALTTFVTASKNHQYWDKLIDVGPLAGNNINSVLVKLKFSGNGKIIENNGFLQADYALDQGLQLHPSKSLNTKTNLNSLNLQGLFGFSMWLSDKGSAWIGSPNSAQPYSILLASSTAVNAYIGNSGGGGGVSPLSDAFYHVIKQSLNSTKVFVDATQIGSANTTLTSTQLRNADIEVFREAGSIGKGLFYCIDNGTLTNLEVQQFYIDVRQLMYDLGRKISPPVISSDGLYTEAQDVSIVETPTNSSTAGANIRYTTDGTLPTLSSPIYTTNLAVSTTTQIHAIAVKNGKFSKPKSAWVSIVPEGFNTKKYYTAHVMINLLAFTSNMTEWVREMKASGYNLIWAHLDDYTGNYITALKSLMDAAALEGGIQIMPGASWWVDPKYVTQMFIDTWNHPALFTIGNKRMYTGWDYQPNNQHIVDSLLALKNITKNQYYLWVHSRYPYSYDGGNTWVGEYPANNGYLNWNATSSGGLVQNIDHLYKTRPQLDGLINFAVDQGDKQNIITTNKVIAQSSIQKGKFSMGGVSSLYASVSFSDFGFKGAAEIWDSLIAMPVGSRPTAMSDITANDYVELSYISPMVIPPTQGLSFIPPFGSGFNLGDNVRYPLTDHSGIQKFLRPWVDAFLNSKPSPSFSEDRMFAWYWLHPKDQQPNTVLPSIFNGYPHLNQQWWNNTVFAKGDINVGGANQVDGIKHFFGEAMNTIRMAVHLKAPAQLKINNKISELKPAGAAYFEIEMGSFRGTPSFSIVRNGVEIKKGEGLQPITNNVFPGGWNFLSTEIISRPPNGTPVYRINTGGTQVTTPSGVFSADEWYTPLPGEIYSNASQVSGTENQTIYQSEVNGSTGIINYAFPVSNGQYSVVLHFAEIYHTAIGNRIFDVSAEGNKVLDDYDIVKKVGSFTATTDTFQVNVTDGLLNIGFSSLASDGGRDRPKISAIEILSNSNNQVPVANAGADRTINLPADSISLNGSGTDVDGTISSYKWTQISGPNTAICNNSTLAAPKESKLIAGTYVFSLVVRDDKLFPGAADEVTVTVNPVPISGTPVYRINAGGGQTTTSKGVFFADASYAPSPGDTYANTSAVAGTTDDAIYQSERNGSTGTFGYAFPVSNGQYTVALHFAEIYYTAVGNRVFDVSMEGKKVLDNFDIIKKVGSNTATAESFLVNVTDGMLNIDFSSLAIDGGRDRAKISAIEILSNSANKVPVANAGVDKIINLPPNNTMLSGSGTDADGTISSYQWTQVSGPNTAAFTNNSIASPMVNGLISGTYVFSLVVKDNQLFPSVADEVTITVNPIPASGTPVYRINAGGGQVTTSRGVFSADTWYSPSPGDTYTTVSAIGGTTDDSIYQSERTGSTGTFGYAFPVTNGQYTVVLHFAEIYYTAIGNRIFDVSLEGTKVLDDYDIIRRAGVFNAVTENFVVNVTDGMLNLNFSSLAGDGGRDRGKISAIEILRNSGSQALVVNAGAGNISQPAELVQKLSATVQPNPSNNYFNFWISGDDKPVEIKIYNVSGKWIETKSNVTTGNSLNVGNNYLPGLYYAVIAQGTDRVILKFIKQHK